MAGMAVAPPTHLPPQQASSRGGVAFTFVAPRVPLDWRTSDALNMDPQALVHPAGVTEAQLAQLLRAAATLRVARLEGDPRLSDGVNGARFLRATQLLQLAGQWEQAVNARDSADAQRALAAMQARLDAFERVRGLEQRPHPYSAAAASGGHTNGGSNPPGARLSKQHAQLCRSNHLLLTPPPLPLLSFVLRTGQPEHRQPAQRGACGAGGQGVCSASRGGAPTAPRPGGRAACVAGWV